MKNNFTREEMKSRLSELWDELSEVSGGELWGKISPESWKLARKLFDLEIGVFMSKKNVSHSDEKVIEEKIEDILEPFLKKWIPNSYAHLVDCDENDGQRLREEFLTLILKTRREAVEEAFKAIEIEKMINTKEEDNSDWFMGFGYNHVIDEIEQKKKEYLDKLKDNQN